VPFTRPLGRTREYVEIVRKVLARQTLEHDGEEWTLPLREGGTGLGKPLKLLAKPVQDRIPIYLGSIGPKAVEQTGEIADGWLPFLLDPARPEVLLEPLHRGLEKSGRDASALDIAAVVPLAIHDDPEVARNLVRPWLAFYLGAMGAKDKNFYVELAASYGHGDAARAVQTAFLEGDRMGAALAITDELIDSAAIATTPGELPERLAAYEAAGVTTLVAVPSGDDKAGVVRTLAEASVHA
jgi:F420-dependent oxidoreductase-like protein